LCGENIEHCIGMLLINFITYFIGAIPLCSSKYMYITV